MEKKGGGGGGGGVHKSKSFKNVGAMMTNEISKQEILVRIAPTIGAILNQDHYVKLSLISKTRPTLFLVILISL